MPRRILMVAFHFPPLAGSSGIQRTLRFVQHLPALGWQPIVLTAHPRAYERTSEDLLKDIPREAMVKRAFALDTARHLSFLKRYPAFLARPDRWLPWRFGAVPAGLELIRRHRPEVLWSTYPIATAHLIGLELHRRTGIPWVADFRDPMAQDDYPEDQRTWRSFKAIEEDAVEHAAFSVFTTRGAAKTYEARYPNVGAERIQVIENGYDEDSFADVEADAKAQGPLNAGIVTLLHSGIVYSSERDPTSLFEALRRIKAQGKLTNERFRIRFRAAIEESMLHRLATKHGVQELIEVMPPIPYREALKEMLRADGLLVLQAANCNQQIPAKLYEYLRARRPVIALTDPLGDTAHALKRAGIDTIAPLDSAESICQLISLVVERRAGSLPSEAAIRAASRLERSRELVALIEEAAEGAWGAPAESVGRRGLTTSQA